jgi:hypothetical protein
MTDECYRKALADRKRHAVTALFEYLFLLRHRRLPAYWEARLGEALVHGELTVIREPEGVGLRQVHEVAAEVADALTTSETVMVNGG